VCLWLLNINGDNGEPVALLRNKVAQSGVLLALETKIAGSVLESRRVK